MPSPPEVVELLGADFARAGEIDNVTVDTAARPRGSPSSPTATPPWIWTPSPSCPAPSERLDAQPGIVDSYVLEVSSPGVDRPLTTEKHFRRARGRRWSCSWPTAPA
jgi:ribosome maturation factor RimP